MVDPLWGIYGTTSVHAVVDTDIAKGHPSSPRVQHDLHYPSKCMTLSNTNMEEPAYQYLLLHEFYSTAWSFRCRTVQRWDESFNRVLLYQAGIETPEPQTVGI